MKYRILVDNRDKFKIEHNDKLNLENHENVIVDGKEYVVEFVSFNENGDIKSIFIDNEYHDIEIEKGNNGLAENIIVDGQKYPVSILKAGRDRVIVEGVERKKSGVIRALIPGKVMNILVKPGQQIKEGELILILEAMKMENEILSARSGVISEIVVSEGENVEKDQVMLVIE
ncbi:MAG: biotin/lipoyl-binding protein [Candidatus Muirbacterium halophilum]|nr:biotin/lipoyl-binding protein [Candidatus Muirbacterium halophilum]MCK9476005.1 biotin/lipoyl-binding protein [Candidatus Muirbacterium halophilum]